VPDHLVWIDCEMTGLDLTRDALVEVAVIVTDEQLTPLDEGIDLVMTAPDAALEQMVDVVREMHTSSGLIEEIKAATLTVPEAEEKVLDYVRQWVPEPKKSPLCGNSVATDRAFLARDMPALEAHLHYRIIDVSSIKELARRWYPKIYRGAPQKRGGHRALADIRESIEELRYYRGTLFVPAPSEPEPTSSAPSGQPPAASSGEPLDRPVH
jgi:oligoribonuclease